jgi:hypothetical protein
MRNSREVAFLKGATGSCRWGLHFPVLLTFLLLNDTSEHRFLGARVLDPGSRHNAGRDGRQGSMKTVRRVCTKVIVYGRGPVVALQRTGACEGKTDHG